jgi:uncharacterized protein (DUF4415 family)
LTDEESITIRVSKDVIEEIRKKKPTWKAVNATMITDIVLRSYLEDLTTKEAQP